MNKIHISGDEFSKAGKALFLCQKFERTCKEIIMWVTLSKSLEEKQFDFLSKGHIDSVDKLLQLYLGTSINNFFKCFTLNEKNKKILTDAKNSRNFICHEIMNDFIFLHNGRNEVVNQFNDRLFFHIQNLARGDYLVSRWSYEFYEKESGYFFDEKKYIKEIETWIDNK